MMVVGMHGGPPPRGQQQPQSEGAWEGQLDEFWWAVLWRALMMGSVPVVLGALPRPIEDMLPHR